MATRRREDPHKQQPPPTGSSRGLPLPERQKFIEGYSFAYCAESSKYEKVAKIGQGTFG